MQASLVIIAAGLGSRYRGLKQLDGVGPQGESIMDYSIRDAIRAGFRDVVLVIRRDFEAECRAKMERIWGHQVCFRYAFQDLDQLPPGFSLPSERHKPWGTGHAILAARDLCQDHFAVINADDYYGPESFRVIMKFFENEGATPHLASLVGFRLGDTVSRHGSVSRGVCETDLDRRRVTGILERKKIVSDDSGIYWVCDGRRQALAPDTRVSMNFWGFQRSIFAQLETEFGRFLREEGHEVKSEFLIPTAVHHLIQAGRLEVRLLHTNSSWFGMTYPEDRGVVADHLNRLGALAPKSLIFR